MPKFARSRLRGSSTSRATVSRHTFSSARRKAGDVAQTSRSISTEYHRHQKAATGSRAGVTTIARQGHRPSASPAPGVQPDTPSQNQAYSGSQVSQKYRPAMIFSSSTSYCGHVGTETSGEAKCVFRILASVVSKSGLQYVNAN